MLGLISLFFSLSKTEVIRSFVKAMLVVPLSQIILVNVQSISVLSCPTCDKFFITLFSRMGNQKYSSYVTLFPSLTFILAHQLLASMTEEKKNILRGPHTVIRRVLKILWHQSLFKALRNSQHIV